MRNTQNMWLVFFIAIIFIFGVQASHAGCSNNINKDIQKIIDDVRTQYQIPGIEVSIHCPEEYSPRDFVSGTITKDGLISVKPDNFFQIGSETKSFTATIILQLEALGLLSIDDPISKWIPHLPLAWKNVTIKQLLNHTSGIFNITESDKFWEQETNSNLQKQWTPEELISVVQNKPSYFEPGMGYHYSNTNYILAGMIISVVTGQSVENEMLNRLFKPLNLSNTYYFSRVYNEDILQRMAHGYSDDFSDKGKDVTDGNMSMADAAGAIISTSHDTAIWLRKLLTSHEVLPEKQQKELMSLVDKNGKPLPSDNKVSGYGLGIALHIDPSGNEIWYHGGSTIGYSSNMLWIKCNDTVLTMTINYNSEKASEGQSVLTDTLIAYIQQSDDLGKCKKTNFIKQPIVSRQKLIIYNLEPKEKITK